MIAGQMADLEAEGRRVSARQLEAIHRGKTGALIRASVRTGALFAGADGPSLQRLSRFGAKLGLAFQIVDDVLDVRSSTRRLGKTVHKDAAHGKATYPAVHGLEKSQRMAGKLVEEACADLEPFGRRAEPLQQISRHLLARTN
jgi:geranylgeranyl diphosphate synthase type II